MSHDASREHLTGRRLSHEHMDDPNASMAEIDEALRFIRIVNRRLGGASAALKQFKRWAQSWDASRTIRVIDVGTGSADIPLAIAQWAQQHGRRVKITGVDLHPVTLACARRFVGERDDIELVQADALDLMNVFLPQSFDYAHAGMFIHHLNDVQALTVLRIMDRLTTSGTIWNDLIREWFGKLGVRLFSVGAPEKVRHDAIVSVDAGFTKREALDLVQRAGWSRPIYRRHLGHRFTVVSDKTSGTAN